MGPPQINSCTMSGHPSAILGLSPSLFSSPGKLLPEQILGDGTEFLTQGELLGRDLMLGPFRKHMAIPTKYAALGSAVLGALGWAEAAPARNREGEAPGVHVRDPPPLLRVEVAQGHWLMSQIWSWDRRSQSRDLEKGTEATWASGREDFLLQPLPALPPRQLSSRTFSWTPSLRLLVACLRDSRTR